MHIRRIIQRDIVDAVLDVIERSATHRVVFVTGEAGIGKSTLLDDVRQELMTDDREIVIARAECSTPVAGQDVGEVESLKPFADIMADLVNVTTSSAVQKRAGFKFDVSKFLVDTAPSWIGLIPVIGSPMSHALNIISSGYDQYYLHGKVRSEASKVAASQEQVFRQYVNFLRGIAQNTPVVLMIDDFHWADTSSTNLLFNLARDLQDVRVAFVVAYREDDARDARSNEGHPIVRIRHELERYDLSKAINVPKVELSEIHTLLTDRFAEYRSNAQLESWLDHHCGSNLLFVTQFLTSLVDNGFLDAQSAKILKDLDQVRVPSSAFAVVQERLRRMSADEKEILRYASVEGETFTVGIVSQLVELNTLKTLQRLRLIEEQHQVIRSLGKQEIYAEETTAFQFVHALLQQALYQDLEAEEREILHGMILEELDRQVEVARERGQHIHVVAVRYAVHAAMLKRFARASELLLDGARAVWQRYAADEALHLIRLVLYGIRRARIIERADPVETEVRALLLQAEISAHIGQNGKASACYLGAIACLDAHPGSPERHRLRVDATLGASSVAWTLNRYEEASHWAEHALQASRLHGYEPGEIRALRLLGNVAYRQGDLDRAYTLYRESEALARTTGDVVSIASAVANQGNVLRQQGRLEDALACYERSLESRRSQHDRPGTARELMNIGTVLRELRQSDDALSMLKEALHVAQSIGDLLMEAQVLNNLCATAQEVKQFVEAIDYAERSIELKRRTGDVEGEARSVGNLANILRVLKRFDDSIETFNVCIELARRVGARDVEMRALYGIGLIHIATEHFEDALMTLHAVLTYYRDRRSILEYDILLGILVIRHLQVQRGNESDAYLAEALESANAYQREHPELSMQLDRVKIEWSQEFADIMHTHFTVSTGDP